MYAIRSYYEEQLQKEAATLFNTALEAMQRHRQREGDKLAELVKDRLALVEAEIQSTRAVLPALMRQLVCMFSMNWRNNFV